MIVKCKYADNGTARTTKKTRFGYMVEYKTMVSHQDFKTLKIKEELHTKTMHIKTKDLVPINNATNN